MKLLKIGGSIITDKDGYRTPDKKAIDRITGEISERPEKLILVHGAGSYGHPLVRGFGLDNAKKNYTNKDYISMERVISSVKNLNKLFISSLIEKGVPAHSIHPSSSVLCRKGRIQSFPVSPVKQSVENGVIPVLHGDMVIDSEYGGSVLSGDKIISYIAKKTRETERIGMATNSPVLNNDGDKIGVFQNKHIKFLSESETTDVTGGMKNKVNELLEIKKPAFIFDATKPGKIKKFLDGGTVGTEINPKKK